jgi:hypothetical protein
MNNSHHYSGCALQKKYKEYPPASWPYAFSCANKYRNIHSKEGREDKCSPIVYIAESCINLHEDNADFVNWVQHQQDLHILEVTKMTINI